MCFEQLEVLKRESQKMEKKINKNVATVLEACEKELQVKVFSSSLPETISWGVVGA